MKTTIKNKGTLPFPYYQILKGKEEICATNSRKKALWLQELISIAAESEFEKITDNSIIIKTT